MALDDSIQADMLGFIRIWNEGSRRNGRMDIASFPPTSSLLSPFPTPNSPSDF